MNRCALVLFTLAILACREKSPRTASGPGLAGFASAWLPNFNGADSVADRRFIREHQGSRPYTVAELDSVVKDNAQFRAQFGPVVAKQVVDSTDSTYALLVGTEKAGAWRLAFRKTRQPSHELVSVELSPAQPLAKMRGPVTVPLTRTASGRPVVSVSVNGSGPLQFVIDIGTNVSIVSSRGLARLRPAAPNRSDQDPDRFLFDSLTLGGARYERGMLLVDDLGPELDGLLGLDLFANHLLTLDYPRSEVRIAEGSLPRSDGRTIFDYSLPRAGSPTISVGLGEHAFPAVLDVGSLVGLSFPDSVAGTLPWSSPPVSGLRHSGPQLADARGTIGRLKGDLKIGNAVIRDPIVETMPSLHDEILLGQPFLTNFSITLDQRHRRVALVPAKTLIVAPPFETAGFRLDSTARGPVVDDVIPGTRAATAGLARGDLVTSINGVAGTGLTRAASHALLDTAGTYSIELSRRGSHRGISFGRTVLVK